MTLHIPAILLAAGASTRLGEPKQLVTLHGETLLDRTIRIATEAGAGPIHTVLGANLAHIRATAQLQHTHILENPNWQQGIATSIHAGLAAIAPDAPGALFLVSDQPAVTAEHLSKLIADFTKHPDSIVASHYAGVNGIPVIFPHTTFAHLRQLTGDKGARQLLRNPPAPLRTHALTNGEQDIDTPADLQTLSQTYTE